jgi:glutamine synthetase
MIRQFKGVLFDGDNYTKEWQDEAHRRGLPDLRNTPDTVPLAISDEAIALFTKHKVYTERELRSRYDILLTNYTKAIAIEGQTALMMGRTMILPAALRYQTEVAAAVTSAKGGGLQAESQAALLEELVGNITSFQHALADLEAALDGQPTGGDVVAQAVYQRDRVLVAMAEVRRWGDRLETQVDDALWPLPTYREMLFVR